MKTVAISLLGTTLDQRGRGQKRWERWRPTVSLCQHPDLRIDRLEVLLQPGSQSLADFIAGDIAVVSPQTEVRQHLIEFRDPWDFETVYEVLYEFAARYPFDHEHEEYLLHITTGTHVAQICLYLLTEAHYLRGKLVQTAPPRRGSDEAGEYQIIDLDLSKYDRIASRYAKEHLEGTEYLKSGIETRNVSFNRMIEQLEQVSIRSREPVLLTGPTGAGKSLLARRVFELKRQRTQLTGNLIEINCATLRGDNAMSALFGHVRGAFTGAMQSRSGLLKEADGGLLFLDEIGELGVDEQAMLLRAIEDKRFMPMGSDQESSSDFQLIAGTNRDLHREVDAGRFREDLLARINLWTYELPSLKERLEDLEPNLEFELERFAQKSGYRIGFNKAARQAYLEFALSPRALWRANFRDLNASVTRMATLASGGRITEAVVMEEIERLRIAWRRGNPDPGDTEDLLLPLIGEAELARLDAFERIRLRAVVDVCRGSDSMADAGRRLFNVSRIQKKSTNDSHRLRQFLLKYGLDFEKIRHG